VDISLLSNTAFVDPFGRNRVAIQALFEQVGQRLLDYLCRAGQHSPLPQNQTNWPRTIPDHPTSLAALLDDLDQILDQSMNPAHPGYMGHMDPLPTAVSIVADWVAAALNNNMLSVEMSPALSRLEPTLMAEIAQTLFGLGPKAGGLLVSGGTLANLQALTLARNVQLNCLHSGLGKVPQPVILASQRAHTSIQKAGMIMGLGTQGIVLVPTYPNGQINVDSLEEKIRTSLKAGQTPFAVVATAGTTVMGNIDPLPQIAALARRYGLWFHVDAAYGGAIAFSPTHRHRLKGIEQADSVTFNPQKWLYVAKTCASVMFRDMAWLDTHFRIAAPYMNAEANWTNLGEISIQGTRHTDALKLWLSLQHLGKQGYATLIDASYTLTHHFVKEIQSRPYLQLASTPDMNVVCFRGCPDAIPPSQWDVWNAGLQQQLLTQGHYFLSLPQVDRARWLKAVLLNPFTTEDHISDLFQTIDRYQAEVRQDDLDFSG
jgi:glutamate/tyrosine decarboxylase-like PLP-dependent enzyme